MSSEVEPNKRRLIQYLSGSGVVVLANTTPDRWARPIVSTAIIPAHAAASGCVNGNEFSFNEMEIEGNSAEFELSCGETSAEGDYEANIEGFGSFESSTSTTLEGEYECGTSIGYEFEGELNNFAVSVTVNGCQISGEHNEFNAT